MNTEKVRFGIIGIGNMGSVHVRHIEELHNTELVAVCDINPAAFDRIAPDTRKHIRCYTAAEEICSDPEVEALIIAVPHYFHPDLAILAMEHGKHVIVEKPIAVHKAEAERLIRESEKHPELVRSLMFNQRTNCLYRRMRELVRSGRYGRIRRTNWIITDWYRPQAYYDSGAWRATWAGEGGGVLLNQCPHQLDLWQWICGMPKRVQAHLSYGLWHDIEVEDDVTTFVEYENGATGVFVTTTGDAHGTNRFEIQMDGAKLVAEDGRLTLLEYEQLEPEWTKTNTAPFATVPCREVEVELDGENPQHVGVINAWGGAILRGEPLVADGREGIQGLTLSNAMHLSSWLGHPVDLPFDEQLFLDELNKRRATSRLKTEDGGKVEAQG